MTNEIEVKRTEVSRPDERHGFLQMATHAVIRKYVDEEAQKQDVPFEVTEWKQNIGLNEGIALIWDLALGSAGSAYNNTNSRMGVGTSSTAETAAQTGLQAGTTAFAGMVAGYPQRTSGTASFRGTFGSGSANFSWQEFVVDNGSGASGTIDMLRKTSDQGTKITGQIWDLTVNVVMS